MKKEKLLVRTEKGIPVEVVTVYAGTNQSNDHVPTPETMAIAVTSASFEWQALFMGSLFEKIPAFMKMFIGAVSKAAAANQQPTCNTCRDLVDFGGFGCDPKDSQQLLELRQAVDSYLGWPNQKAEEAGDYVGRVREVGEKLPLPRAGAEALDEELQQIDAVLRRYGFDPEIQNAVEKALGKQREKIARQRRELRFLNKREEDRVKWLKATNHAAISSSKVDT